MPSNQRLEKALTARTLGELAALTRDLPTAPGFAVGAQAARPKNVIQIDRQGGPEVPVILRIAISGTVGSGHIRVRPRRRNRRRPGPHALAPP
jgi:uncharacterized protein DUF1707